MLVGFHISDVFRYMFCRESREKSGNMNKTDGDDNSETAQAVGSVSAQLWSPSPCTVEASLSFMCMLNVNIDIA